MAWLAAHPEAQADVEADAALMRRWRNCRTRRSPIARVLQAIETGGGEGETAVAGKFWWQVFGHGQRWHLVVGGGLSGGARGPKQQELTSATRPPSGARRVASDPVLLADFEVIASLSPAESVADEGLLAMKRRRMALSK